jgi:hypothetical protein
MPSVYSTPVGRCTPGPQADLADARVVAAEISPINGSDVTLVGDFPPLVLATFIRGFPAVGVYLGEPPAWQPAARPGDDKSPGDEVFQVGANCCQ